MARQATIRHENHSRDGIQMGGYVLKLHPVTELNGKVVHTIRHENHSTDGI